MIITKNAIPEPTKIVSPKKKGPAKGGLGRA